MGKETKEMQNAARSENSYVAKVPGTQRHARLASNVQDRSKNAICRGQRTVNSDNICTLCTPHTSNMNLKLRQGIKVLETNISGHS